MLTASSYTQPSSSDVKTASPAKPKVDRGFDPSRYNTRLIALKLAYLGKNYNGFEHHLNNTTPLPTIEEELWKAFNKARLIFPKGSTPAAPGEVNWEGCEYSKCGRTDKGVSAFGQVIGIRVRSNRPMSKKKATVVDDDVHNTLPRDGGIEIMAPPLSASTTFGEEATIDSTPSLAESAEGDEDVLNFDPIADEIPYATLLNRLLPPDIRILAWCPFPPLDFSARFSCRERQYRYFFTQPAYCPTPHNLEDAAFRASKPQAIKDGWLDIDAMRKAAKLYEGVHDFRNFCKVDASKQITNFERRIFHADIEEVQDSTAALGFLNAPELIPQSAGQGAPKIYTFTLHGSAFLWHQVRHMVAILFLVGQGLEQPNLVSELLDTKSNPCRPVYEMASDTPLVLWNCIFPSEDDPDRKDVLQWHYVGSDPNFGDQKFGTPGLMDDLWRVWRERKIDEVLAGNLIEIVSKQGKPYGELTAASNRRGAKSQKVFDGSDGPLMRGNYIPVMKKHRMDSVETVNKRYALRKGFESVEEMKELGYRRLNVSSTTKDDVAE